jgi:hypothetical protein
MIHGGGTQYRCIILSALLDDSLRLDGFLVVCGRENGPDENMMRFTRGNGWA